MNWDNGHLSDISDIFRTFIGHTTKVQNLSSKEALMNSKYKKPQINADERRYVHVTEFDGAIHRKGRKERKAAQHEPFLSCVTKIRYGINNELGRTDTNSGHSEFVRVRISSLLISVLRLLFAPAPERAQPAPAVHSRSSRAGG
jgi:hypothetical protein